MNNLLNDRNTYEKVSKPPFKTTERQLNKRLLQLKREQKLDENMHIKKLHSTDAIPPSLKHHKPNNPLRPIGTCRHTALYNTSKFLTDIFSLLQNQNGYSVSNSTEFTTKLHDINIDDEEIMVSFDVVSLFTAIPVDRASM